MQAEQKVEKYESFTDLEEGVVAEGQEGWTAISFIQNMKFFYYVVLYRKSPNAAFSAKAIERLLSDGDADEQTFASALLTDQWLQ